MINNFSEFSNNFDFNSFFIAVLTAMAASILGVFLILKRMPMVIDAISHSVLLGIVLTFLIVRDLNSPYLIMGATLIGVFTSYLSDILSQHSKINEDAAIGITFAFLFALAVFIITIYIRDAHLDIDAVFTGSLEFINSSKIKIILSVFLLNLFFCLVFYKELKLSLFDKNLAVSLGFYPTLINYILITLVSATSVAAFEMSGSILMISFFIAPAATALLITKNLFSSVLFSMFFAFLGVFVGYSAGIWFNMTLSGAISSAMLLIFLLFFIFETKNGVITKLIQKNKQRKYFGMINLLIHIQNHEKKENIIQTQKSLKWSSSFYQKCLKKTFQEGYVQLEGEKLHLTHKGEELLIQQQEILGI
ncbi:metal ABC transporter permease [Vaccinium witches'-broom phytoplasma]|uniref:metal ABC transporter permease n=1 Tax=Vaccinium witches'-broom phytoplasma TaxID=85642 RepID=UPI0003761AD3|nr:metal ABC transporter permease [Vaccinium witches'-broom phytoplasma]